MFSSEQRPCCTYIQTGITARKYEQSPDAFFAHHDLFALSSADAKQDDVPLLLLTRTWFFFLALIIFSAKTVSKSLSHSLRHISNAATPEAILFRSILCRVPPKPGPCNALIFYKNADIAKVPHIIAITA